MQPKPENQESTTENDVDEKIEETVVDVKKEAPAAEEAPAEEAPAEEAPADEAPADEDATDEEKKD